MTRKPWMQEDIQQSTPPTPENQDMGEYKEPGFVEVVNNVIYYYGDVDSSKILHLIKTIKEKEAEQD
jgi:hypothetical protein